MIGKKKPVLIFKLSYSCRDEDLDRLAKELTEKTGRKCIVIDSRVAEVMEV